MKKVLLLALLLSGCNYNRGETGAQGAPGESIVTTQPVYVEVPAEEVIEVEPTEEELLKQEIEQIVQDENGYRELLGQNLLSKGLSCSVQKVNSGQCISSSSTAQGCNSGNVINTSGNTAYSYLYSGQFNQPSGAGSGVNGLIPSGLRPLFVNLNFVIRCTGQIVVLESGYYSFSLDSDDGSILTVDGQQVVNNDNNHGMTLKSGVKFLRKGVRSFSLQYAQTGSGQFGLILKVNGELVNKDLFYR